MKWTEFCWADPLAISDHAKSNRLKSNFWSEGWICSPHRPASFDSNGSSEGKPLKLLWKRGRNMIDIHSPRIPDPTALHDPTLLPSMCSELLFHFLFFSQLFYITYNVLKQVQHRKPSWPPTQRARHSALTKRIVPNPVAWGAHRLRNFTAGFNLPSSTIFKTLFVICLLFDSHNDASDHC